MKRAYFLGEPKKGETASIVTYDPKEVAKAEKEMDDKGLELMLDLFEYIVLD